MALKRQYTASLPVQLTPEWRERVKAVADHETVNVSMAQVIRDCVAQALPGFELALGLRSIEDFDAEELKELGIEVPAAKPAREDRAEGSFGWTPPEG